MKYVLKIFEIIFNPFFSILTANENNKNSKGFFQNIKKNHFILLLISVIITVAIILAWYHKEIFGV